MESTGFKETNHVLGAGDNPNTDQLPICYATNPNIPGMVFMVSKFKLSDADLIKINQTGELWISVMGVKHPPIMPTVDNPFQELDYKPMEIE